MMQEHMSVEENQALGSSPFMLVASFFLGSFCPNNIIHCFFYINFSFVIGAILKYMLYYYTILTKKLIILIMSNGNRT